MAGRISKLTPEREAKICDLLEAGNTRKCAAECGGISYEAMMDWLEKGRSDRNGYKQFLLAVTRAEEEAERRRIETILTAADGAEQVTRITKTVFKQVKEVLADGTRVQRYEPFEDVTETRTFVRDWRAAAWWAERKNRLAWGAQLDIRKLEDDQLLRIIGLMHEQQGGGTELTEAEYRREDAAPALDKPEPSAVP